MTRAFIGALENTAAFLARFADPPSAGGRRWNGTEYVDTHGQAQAFDPYAAKWWSALTVLAGILSSQEVPLSNRQKEFLRTLLFGGMGSLNDFVFDERYLGTSAKPANQELKRLRAELFAAYQAA